MSRTAVAMLAVCALSGCTAKGSGFSASDESAVRTLVTEFANTWNRHDMAAMHALDTDDVEWINVTGNDWRGKGASIDAEKDDPITWDETGFLPGLPSSRADGK